MDKITKPRRELLNAKELATMLSVSVRTVWRLRSAGMLPQPVSVGGSKRWRISDLNLFLDCDCDMDKFRARNETEDVR